MAESSHELPMPWITPVEILVLAALGLVVAGWSSAGSDLAVGETPSLVWLMLVVLAAIVCVGSRVLLGSEMLVGGQVFFLVCAAAIGGIVVLPILVVGLARQSMPILAIGWWVGPVLAAVPLVAHRQRKVLHLRPRWTKALLVLAALCIVGFAVTALTDGSVPPRQWWTLPLAEQPLP